jgi:hypothetical protein
MRLFQKTLLTQALLTVTVGAAADPGTLRF